MKHQALFSSKDESKEKIKVSSATISLGSLKLNCSIFSVFQVRDLRRLFLTLFYILLLTGNTFAVAFPSKPMEKPESIVIEHGSKITVQTSGCRSLSMEQLRERMGGAFDSATMAYDEESIKRSESLQELLDRNNGDLDDYVDDEDEIDDIEDIMDTSHSVRKTDSTFSVQNRKYMRRKRDATLTSDGHYDVDNVENSNELHDSNFLYQNLAYSTINKRKSRKKRGANNKFHPAWECKKKKVWLKMKDGYFPSRILDGKCKTDTCFFGIYNCNPVKYAIKVLKRDPDDACKPVPLIGQNTTYEESWVFKRIHVTVACECGQSWKAKKRKRTKEKRTGDMGEW